MYTSALKQLLFLLFTVLVCFVVCTIVCSVIGIFFFGTEILSNPSIILSDTNYLRFYQLSQSVSLFILPPILYAKYYRLNIKQYYQIGKIPKLSLFALGFLLVMLVQPLVSYLGYLNQLIPFPEYLADLEKWLRIQEDQASDLTQLILSNDSRISFIFNILVVAVVPAVGEELLFRGGIQPLFARIFKNKHIGVWLSAFLFSAIHMQFFGFFPRLILGALFGYMVMYGKSLWLPIFCHFVNNFLALLMFALYQNKFLDEDPLSSATESINYVWLGVSLVGFVIAIRMMKNVEKVRES